MIILKGLKTGLITLNSKLSEKNYLVKTNVNLYIIEHFTLVPENYVYL